MLQTRRPRTKWLSANCVERASDLRTTGGTEDNVPLNLRQSVVLLVSHVRPSPAGRQRTIETRWCRHRTDNALHCLDLSLLDYRRQGYSSDHAGPACRDSHIVVSDCPTRASPEKTATILFLA